jgi:hypothetical protein
VLYADYKEFENACEDVAKFGLSEDLDACFKQSKFFHCNLVDDYQEVIRQSDPNDERAMEALFSGLLTCCMNTESMYKRSVYAKKFKELGTKFPEVFGQTQSKYDNFCHTVHSIEKSNKDSYRKEIEMKNAALEFKRSWSDSVINKAQDLIGTFLD